MKKLLAFALLASAALLLAAGPAKAAPPKGKIIIKVASVAPEGVGWSKHIKSVVFPVIEKVTRGEVQLKVFWGASLGDEENYIRLMKEGSLQGAGLSAQGTVMLCPQTSVLELPFLLNNYLEADYLRIKMDGYWRDLLEKKGFFLIGMIDQDFDEIYSTKYPMTTLEDFAKSRFLSWYGPMEVATLAALGATAIPVSVPDFASAVNSGKGDAVILPAPAIIGTQTHSKFRYINTVRIRYSPATLVMTTQAFNQFPQKYLREFFLQRPLLGWKYAKLARQDNEKYVQAMVKYGLKQARMEPSQLEAMRAATRKVWTQQAGVLFPKELLDIVQRHLEEFRAGKRLTMDDMIRFVRLDKVTLTAQALKEIKEIARQGMEEGLGGSKLFDLE